MHTYTSKSSSNTNLAVIVGGGITGLVAARNIALKGAKAILLEADDRLGGRIYDFKAILDDKSYQFPYGANRMEIKLHENLMAELLRYKLNFETKREERVYLQHLDLGAISLDDMKLTLGNNETFQASVKKINSDAMAFFDVHCGDGSLLAEHESLDVSIRKYVENVLNLHGYAAEYYFLQVFLMFGAGPDDISTVSLLQLIHWFDFDIRNVFAFNERYQYLPEGFTSLINCMERECISLGVEIYRNSPVISIIAKGREVEEHIVVTDSFPFTSQFTELGGTAIVKTAHGQEFIARSVVVAVPMACLHSIRFDPPLPVPLQSAIQRCNGSQHFLRQYALIDGNSISHRVNKVYFLSSSRNVSLEVVDCTVMHRDDPPSNNCLVYVSGDRNTILNQSLECFQYAHPDVNALQEVWCHDFLANPWIRTAWFTLRAGTRNVYLEACHSAQHPWGEGNRLLYIGNADLSCDYWPGWMEGGIAIGQRAAEAVLPQLIHPPIARNYARKVKSGESKK